jgi:hypothetical protein
VAKYCPPGQAGQLPVHAQPADSDEKHSGDEPQQNRSGHAEVELQRLAAARTRLAERKQADDAQVELQSLAVVREDSRSLQQADDAEEDDVVPTAPLLPTTSSANPQRIAEDLRQFIWLHGSALLNLLQQRLQPTWASLSARAHIKLVRQLEADYKAASGWSFAGLYEFAWPNLRVSDFYEDFVRSSGQLSVKRERRLAREDAISLLLAEDDDTEGQPIQTTLQSIGTLTPLE